MRRICKLLTSGERRISSARLLRTCRRRPSAKRPSQFGGRDGTVFGLADLLGSGRDCCEPRDL